jgi:hypothetical protein
VRAGRYLGRYRGKSGHTVGVPKPTLVTRNGHRQANFAVTHTSKFASPVKACREQVTDFGGSGPCALIDGTMGEYRIETTSKINGRERP